MVVFLVSLGNGCSYVHNYYEGIKLVTVENFAAATTTTTITTPRDKVAKTWVDQRCLG